jgi:DNA polymerase-3 subunit gamma/tau
VAHAYLFSGPRGTGKTSTGRILAKALNCRDRQQGEPCNRCESCISYAGGRAMDLVELDAASNRGIDEIRSLRDKVAFAPGAGDYKVYLIDEVHMLTEAAFNALLKTLEEPPPHAVFVLATTEAHKLPATIASRCQRFDFRRAPLASMVKNLERICEGESFDCEPAALELIARSATGSHRDAVNLLDQLATSYGNQLTAEHVRVGLGLIGDERAGRLARLALAGDLAGGLTLIASVRDDGLDLRQFQRELIDEMRDLLMVKSGLEPAEGATQERLSDLRDAVAAVTTAQLLTALRAFGEADLKTDPNSTLPLDIALAECALADGQAGASNGQADNRAVGQQVAPPPARPSTLRPGSGQAGSGRTETNAPRPAPAPARPEALEGRADTGAIASSSEAAGLIPQGPSMPAAASLPPELEPAPVRVTSAVAPTLAAARDQMRPIYEKARAAGFQLGALLNSGCDIIEADESGIVLGFRYPIHANKASEKQNLDVLTAIVSEVMGRPLSVRCVESADVTAWTQRDSASRSPLVRAAQEMGARILTSDPED